MAKLCVFDVETTSNVPSECRITELGAALVAIPLNSLVMMGHFNMIVYEDHYEPQTEAVLKITPHLTDDVLKAQGRPFTDAVASLIQMFDAEGWPDFFVAHNAEFDEEVFRRHMKINREALIEIFGDDLMQKIWGIPWGCSIVDIPWPEEQKCKKLSHLALDYGVKMDGRNLHCAIDDVMLLVDLLSVLQLQWSELLERWRVPWRIVRAVIPSPYGAKGDGGAGKDRCKELKFRYQDLGKVSLKSTWLKRVKDDEIEALQDELGYPLRIVQ